MFVVRPINVVEGSEFDVTPMACETVALARAHAAGLARWFMVASDSPKRIAIEQDGRAIEELHVDELASLDYLGLDYK